MSSRSERHTLHRLIAAWDRFWFAAIPSHSYALLRILFGALGCVSLIGLSDVATFWALDGLVPDDDGGLGLKAWLQASGLQDIGPYLLYFTTLASFFSMTVGYRSGASVTASLAFSIIQILWNYLPLSGAHVVMQGVLFCLLWADCGSVWSVDAWLERRRATDGSPISFAQYPIAPLRLIRFQIALIYLSTGLWKLYSPLWREGSALHYILNNNVFHRFPLSIPPEAEWLLTTATYLTLVWELGFAPGVMFRRTRRLVLVLGIMIHLGMLAFIEVGPFSFVMLSAYVAFVDPRRVPRLPSVISGYLRAPTYRGTAHHPAD